MAESVRHAKQHLQQAREAQRERAAAFWQRAIDEGRLLQQSAQRQPQTRVEAAEDWSTKQTP